MRLRRIRNPTVFNIQFSSFEPSDSSISTSSYPLFTGNVLPLHITERSLATPWFRTWKTSLSISIILESVSRYSSGACPASARYIMMKIFFLDIMIALRFREGDSSWIPLSWASLSHIRNLTLLYSWYRMDLWFALYRGWTDCEILRDCFRMLDSSEWGSAFELLVWLRATVILLTVFPSDDNQISLLQNRDWGNAD